jgi:hypothetical protein
MVAKKGKESLNFYSDEGYKKWEAKQKNLNSWSIEYKKGLAALEDAEYKDIIRSPRTFTLTKDSGFNNTLDIWFSKDSAPRKSKILGEEVTIKNNKSLF